MCYIFLIYTVSDLLLHMYVIFKRGEHQPVGGRAPGFLK